MTPLASQPEDRPPFCWVNGLRVDPQLPVISPLDRGFLLADGCFETMRAYAGVIFRLDAHLERLASTLARLSITFPPHLDETIADVVRALRTSGADLAVRLTVTRGIGSGVAPRTGVQPTTVVFVDRLPAVPSSLRTQGLSVRIAEGRRNEFAPTAGLKTLAYTDAVVALSAARSEGADDALLLDTKGHLSEGSSSNLFLVLRGVVHTPPPQCGVLLGITRAAVLQILRQLDIPVEEFPIPAHAIAAADEMFLTSSLREIAPVTMVDGRPVGVGKVGPLTIRVMDAYQRLIADDVRP